MKLNTIIGTLGADREIYSQQGDEVYYKTTITIDGDSMPLIASGYVLREKQGKCKISCTIKQNGKQGIQRCTHLYAIYIEECADQETQDINEFYLGGRIIEKFPMTVVGSACEESLVFKISTYQSKQLNIHMLVATGKMARKLSDIHKGQVVNCRCYMNRYKGRIQFCIIDGTCRDSLSSNKGKTVGVDNDTSANKSKIRRKRRN